MSDPYELVANEFDFMEGSDFRTACEHLGLKLIQAQINLDSNNPYDIIIKELIKQDMFDLKAVCETLGLKLVPIEKNRGDGRKTHYGERSTSVTDHYEALADAIDPITESVIDSLDIKNACEMLGLKLVRIEVDRGDGRKAHYGEGKQPVDTIREHGWAPGFFAGNVVKYLRRSKDPEHSLESARIYYKWLCEECRNAGSNAYQDALIALTIELTTEELGKVMT